MKNLFHAIFKGKVVIVGIGNIMRGDDGFGPALIENIKGKTKALCIDGSSAPENYLGRIVKEAPDNILLVDVAHLGLEAGVYTVIDKSKIVECGFTTHDISPKLFIEYLEKNTKADIFMLGVQPETLGLGREMSQPLKKTLSEVTKLIMEIG
jgi:hydrogenase 3 maturation protease